MTDNIRAGYFGLTTTKNVTDEAGTFTVNGAPESRHAFLVQSDVAVHLTRTPTGEMVVDANTATGLRVPADTIVLVNTFAGDVLSFVASEEEAEGTLWFTATDH